MKFQKRKTHEKIPEGFSADSIRIESSIRTGEKTIGFYSPAEKKLMFAELVRGETVKSLTGDLCFLPNYRIYYIPQTELLSNITGQYSSECCPIIFYC